MLDFFRIVPKKRVVRFRKRRGILLNNPGGWRRWLFYTGSWLAMGVFLAGIYWYWPIIRSVIRYKTATATTILPTITPILEKIEIDLSYRIIIPKILAEAEVVENISPYDPVEYQRVLSQDRVAQAKETAKPGSGKGKSVYLFAHSSREGITVARTNPVFFLLGELKSDDEVIIQYHGKEKRYRVYDKKIVTASNLDYLNYSDPEREVLILQTCWPIGTDWKRLLVFAEAKEE